MKERYIWFCPYSPPTIMLKYLGEHYIDLSQLWRAVRFAEDRDSFEHAMANAILAIKRHQGKMVVYMPFDVFFMEKTKYVSLLEGIKKCWEDESKWHLGNGK